MNPATLGLALAAALAIPAAASSVVIDWVTIGDPGNAADPTTGYGSVAYSYQIAKNETTIAQYADFLNAVAKSDSYGLYHTSMASNGNISGIMRSGTSGNYNYSVIGSGNRPFTYTSWFDAARFANWMHNGQPTGAQDASTTEDGAYTLNGAISGIITKNVGATVWIPTENEWYKAAYYDPTRGGGNYWLYATRTDSPPDNDPTVPGGANYFNGDYAVTQSSSYTVGQNYLTDVGAYGVDSASYYGTNDQTGNASEWNDTEVSSGSRGKRGGAWYTDWAYLLSSQYRDYANPANHLDGPNSGMSFRLASIPEPSSTLLTLIFSTGLLCRRRRNA